MPSLSDNELDRLSRDAAEKYEVEQHFGAWNKLEELLNKELGKPLTPIPRIAKPGIRFLYVPAAILLAGIATYFLIKPTTHNTNSTPKSYQSETANPNTDHANDQQKKDVVKAGNDQPAKTDVAHENAATDKTHNASAIDNGASNVSSANSAAKKQSAAIIVTGKSESSSSSQKQHKKIVGIEKTADLINSADNINSVGKNLSTKTATNNSENENALATTGSSHSNKTKNNFGKTHQAKNQNDDTGNITNNESSVTSASVNSQKIKAVNNTEKNLKPADIAGIQSLPHHNTNINDALLKNASAQRSLMNPDIINPGKKKNNRSLVTKRPLEFGIVYSPDFSRVKYNYNNRVGDNFGFTIDYQLSGKLSVNSGFIFATKNYGAQGKDFHLPMNSGINQNDLDFAIANEHFYEIPLNLRYDFTKANNVLFFVNAGFSSYISHKENYKFYLHNTYNPLSNWGWLYHTYNANQAYWFSVLNLSVGFEAKLSNTVSLQVEPYVKLPLSGVGFGRVDLSSYGINTAIKFAPLLKRSRK